MGSLVGGIFGKNKQPEAPNPAATAAAQTATNIGTAVANAYLTNPTQINSRGGYTSYTQTGEQQWNDPVTGQTYTIPTFTMQEVLSPIEAGTEANNQDTKLKLSYVGNDQAQKVSDLLSTNFNLDSAPAAADRAGTIGGFVNDPANAVTRSYSDPAGYAAQRDKVEAALMDRMQPQLDRDRANLEQRLANQGLTVGTDAYNMGFDEYNRSVNDARLGAILNAGQEQNRLAELDRNAAAFGNQALQQQYGMNAAVADARASDRADYINEAQLLRNQPLNEISTLLGGSQIMPQQFVKANTPQMPTVDYAGLVNSNYAQQMQANSAQQAAQADVVKGLLGFAGGFI